MKLIGRRLSIYWGGTINILIEKRHISSNVKVSKENPVCLENVYDIHGEVVYKNAGEPADTQFGLTANDYITNDSFWITKEELKQQLEQFQQ